MYVYNFLKMVTPTPGGPGLKPLHLAPSLALFFTFGKRDPYSTIFPGFDDFRFWRRSSFISMCWSQVFSYVFPSYASFYALDSSHSNRITSAQSL